MKPYKLKHRPTGLYYQPIKGDTHLSIGRGKVYQTAIHGLSEALKTLSHYTSRGLRRPEHLVAECRVGIDTRVYKNYAELIPHRPCGWTKYSVWFQTSLLDWDKEYFDGSTEPLIKSEHE